jgi:hypothetical protein
MRPIKRTFKAGQQDPWYPDEEARRRQLCEDGRRPLAVNLAEGLALSEFLSTFTGAARSTSSQDQSGHRD